MKTATTSWAAQETDPQRIAILIAADRLLAGTPRHSTGNLSVIQLAAEAQVKYWIVAQKHSDLRDHFQALAAHTNTTAAAVRANRDPLIHLEREHSELKARCSELAKLTQAYAVIINELTLENQHLRTPTASTPTARRLRSQPHNCCPCAHQPGLPTRPGEGGTNITGA